MTLNPEELIVESFEPAPASYGSSFTIIQPDTDPNNPTPNTYCFVCD